jgi:hypothetical protein
VLAYNLIVYINIDFYSCYIQDLSKKFSKPNGGRTNGLDADAGPLGIFLFSPMFLVVLVHNIIVHHNIDFCSYYVQYSSNQFSKLTSGSPMVQMWMLDLHLCCYIFPPVLQMVLAYNVIVYTNIDFYSC